MFYKTSKNCEILLKYVNIIKVFHKLLDLDDVLLTKYSISLPEKRLNYA